MYICTWGVGLVADECPFEGDATVGRGHVVSTRIDQFCR